MKIRTKLTLQNTIVVAMVFLLCMAMAYFISEHSRRTTFFHDLRSEAIARVHMYLMEKSDTAALQPASYIDKDLFNDIDVNVFDTGMHRLYRSAPGGGSSKTGKKLLQTVLRKKEVRFYEGRRQGIGLVYSFNGKEYIVTATAYDENGIGNLYKLQEMLLFLFAVGLTLLFIACYYLAYNSLRPIREIVKEVENITEQHIHRRLPVKNKKDELGELSIAFNDLLERMDASFTSQKMFVSNVSHEMRTPLAAIIAGLDISLQKERTGEEYRKTIQNALQDARRMTKLTDGLLNLAKASYHKEQIKKQKIRLDELLLDARATIMKAHPEYCIEILFEDDGDGDDSLITVMGNLYLLNIAFSNLIENNCKYSADKSSFIQISYWDKLVIVRLSDCGTGMTDKDKQNLFTLFYRGEQEEAATEGYGIGMTLSQKIIHLHEGNITVYSEQDKGTTFVVELPHI